MPSSPPLSEQKALALLHLPTYGCLRFRTCLFYVCSVLTVPHLVSLVCLLIAGQTVRLENTQTDLKIQLGLRFPEVHHALRLCTRAGKRTWSIALPEIRLISGSSYGEVIRQFNKVTLLSLIRWVFLSFKAGHRPAVSCDPCLCYFHTMSSKSSGLRSS